MRVEAGRLVLARAAVSAGGVEALAARLDVSERILRHYLEGKEPIPDAFVLKVIDIVLGDIPDSPN